MGACSRRAATGVRNKALLAVLYRSGLRISEALALRPKDLDRKAGTVRVLHGKGDKARTVGLDDGAWGLLDSWLAKREKLGISPRASVFSTLDGKPVLPSYIRALLPRLARKAGIAKRVHAHGLRHSMAAELRQEGIDIGIISKQLGHSSVGTTARYFDQLKEQVVIDTIKARGWSAVTPDLESICPECGCKFRSKKGRKTCSRACQDSRKAKAKFALQLAALGTALATR
jgi:site-specific recombinase XerD